MKKIGIGINIKAAPGNYISLLLSALKEDMGADTDKILNKVPVKQAVLNNPREWVGLATLYKLIQAAYDISDQPAMGLYYGRRLNLSAHGYVGYAAMCSNNLEQAIEIGIKYLKTRTPLMGIEFFIDEDNQQAVMQFTTYLIYGRLRRFMLETVISSFHQMRSFLLGDKLGEAEVCFKYPKPSYSGEYNKFFGSKAKFGQKANQYRIPLSELNHRLALADPHAKANALLQCEHELSRLSEQQDLITTIRLILLEQPGFIPDMLSVAERLHMSPRTMRRHLSQLHTSFQEIVDNVREEIAMKYLEETTLSIEEISDLLGYSNPSNFSNAFKRWTGRVPSEVRESAI